MFNVVEIVIVHINNSSAPSFGREHEHVDSALNIHCKLHNFDLSFLNLPCMHALMSLSPYYYITTLTWYIFFCLRQTTTMTRSSSSRQAATRPAHTSRRSAPGSSAIIANIQLSWFYCASGIMTLRFLSLIVLLKNRIMWWKGYFEC